MAAITPHAQNLRSYTNEEEEEEKSHASPVQTHEYVALNFTGHAHRAPAQAPAGTRRKDTRLRIARDIADFNRLEAFNAAVLGHHTGPAWSLVGEDLEEEKLYEGGDLSALHEEIARNKKVKARIREREKR